jgi:transcriptional regulator with XRE-family HTH domain
MVYGEHHQILLMLFEKRRKRMDTEKLGDRLRQVRNVRGMSLREAAEKAGISTAYLQKLEQDRVRSPSPNVLYSLAEQLKVPYSELMKLAGYVVPRDGKGRKPIGESMLAHALSSEELTNEEAEELAKYLAWFRSQKGSRA